MNETAVAPERSVPVTVTEVPAAPLVGEKLDIAGTVTGGVGGFGGASPPTTPAQPATNMAPDKKRAVSPQIALRFDFACRFPKPIARKDIAPPKSA